MCYVCVCACACVCVCIGDGKGGLSIQDLPCYKVDSVLELHNRMLFTTSRVEYNFSFFRIIRT